MRFPTSVLLPSLLTLSLQAQGAITIHAKVVDWRGRPVADSTVSLTVVRRDKNLTTTLFRQTFQNTPVDGNIDMEGPAGTWQLEVFRTSTRRGQPWIERNTPRRQAAPEFSITASNTPDNPMVFRLGLGEWNVDTGTAVWMLDMTTCTQGQTFRMDETRAIPLR
jgi:hypothetical protein